MRLRELLLVSALVVGCDPLGEGDVVQGTPGDSTGAGGASAGSGGTSGPGGAPGVAGEMGHAGTAGYGGDGSVEPGPGLAGSAGSVGEPDAGAAHGPEAEDGGAVSSDAGAGDAAVADCPLGTYDADADPSTPCLDWADCEPGQYVAEAGDSSRNRVCAGCSTGTFSSDDNAPACVPWRDCGIDTYVVELPSASRNRACSDCAVGTQAPEPNLSVCVELGACAPGTRVTTPAGDHTPAECAECAVGTYCSGGDAPLRPCGDQEWDHDANSATACAAHTLCIPGQLVDEGGTSTTDRLCAPCAVGSFSSEDNAPECTTHERCQEGSEQSEAGTSTTPSVCSPCAVGGFCPGGEAPRAACALGTWDHDGNSASACESQTECGPGHYVAAAGDATSDRECEPCQDGAHAAGLNASSCDTWTDCQPGSYVDEAPSAVADRQCASCLGTDTSATVNAPTCDTIGISICPGSQPTLQWDAATLGYSLDAHGGLTKDNTAGWNRIALSSDAAFAANDDFCFEHVATAQAGYNQIMFGVRFSDFAGAYLSAGTYLDARNYYYFGAGTTDQFTLAQINAAPVGVPQRYSIRRQGNTLTVAINGSVIYQSSGASWLKAGRPAALLFNDITRIESASGQ